MAGPSLMELLATIPDPRKARGRIHPLTAVLSLTALAILAGQRSLEAIAQFGRDHGVGLAHALGFRRKKTPAKSTLSEIFRALDPDAVEAAFRAWICGRLPDPGAVLAVDGKTLKGSASAEAPGVHLLAAYAPAVQAVLAQIRVDAKTNEHKAALRLLGVLPLAGKVVTGDAMFTHRDVAQEIRDRGGDYLLFVKGNQPELKAAIESALHGDADFSPLPAPAEAGGRTRGTGRGQGARAAGIPAAGEHDVAQRLPGLAGCGAGL